METTVPVDQVIVTRSLKPGDNLDELIESITESGLKNPILLNGNYILVDGLRRLRAAAAAGMKTIPATVTDDFTESVPNLAQAHNGVPPHERRMYEIYELLRPQIQARFSAQRSMYNRWKPPPGQPDRVAYSSRDELARALGGVAYSLITSATAVYRPKADLTKQQRRVVKEAQSKVDSGEWTAYRGRSFIVSQFRDLNLGMPPAETRDMLLGVSSSLRSIVGILNTLPEAINTRPEVDLKSILEDFERGRRAVHVTINKIRRALEDS